MSPIAEESLALPPQIGLQNPTPIRAVWLLHFREPRPPQEIQFRLERELMAVMPPRIEAGKLVCRTQLKNNTGAYSLVLTYEAALARTNFYSLRVEVSWSELPASQHEYCRKTSKNWFDLWTRDFQAAASPSAGEGSARRYRRMCEAALNAEAHLDSIDALQQAIVIALKRGASFTTSHKEGGTKIYCQNGRFIRSDHGESQQHREFVDEKPFLEFLRQFYASDISRNAYRTKVPDYEAWRLILRLLQTKRSAPFNYRMPTGLMLVLVLVPLTVFLAVWQFGTIKSTGIPLGSAARLPDTIAQSIRTQE